MSRAPKPFRLVCRLRQGTVFSGFGWYVQHMQSAALCADLSPTVAANSETVGSCGHYRTFARCTTSRLLTFCVFAFISAISRRSVNRVDRQAHNIEIISRNPSDKTCAIPLDAIRAGLSDGSSSRHDTLPRRRFTSSGANATSVLTKKDSSCPPRQSATPVYT